MEARQRDALRELAEDRGDPVDAARRCAERLRATRRQMPGVLASLEDLLVADRMCPSMHEVSRSSRVV
jgi:hypothetical protein